MNIEISIGEYLDRLSILEIKQAEIKEEAKRSHVMNELRSLGNYGTYKYQYDYYYKFWSLFVYNSFLTGSNMMLFNPENVAGHPAYYQAPGFDKNWISATNLISRYRLGESLLDGINRISGNATIITKINISNVVRYGNIILKQFPTTCENFLFP
jgi:hypothetical protein